VLQRGQRIMGLFRQVLGFSIISPPRNVTALSEACCLRRTLARCRQASIGRQPTGVVSAA
jgi:hypothetical protein